MEFFQDATQDDWQNFKLSDYPSARWRWVSFDENDLKHNIHIYVNSQPDGVPRGWQIYSTETCLGKYANSLLASNFTVHDDLLIKEFNCIKRIYENFDSQQFFDKQNPFRFIGHNEQQPFMIADGVHRLNALFILQIIEKRKIVEMPIKWALCGIWNNTEGDFGRIPKGSCPDL